MRTVETHIGLQCRPRRGPLRGDDSFRGSALPLDRHNGLLRSSPRPFDGPLRCWDMHFPRVPVVISSGRASFRRLLTNDAKDLEYCDRCSAPPLGSVPRRMPTDRVRVAVLSLHSTPTGPARARCDATLSIHRLGRADFVVPRGDLDSSWIGGGPWLHDLHHLCGKCSESASLRSHDCRMDCRSPDSRVRGADTVGHAHSSEGQLH